MFEKNSFKMLNIVMNSAKYDYKGTECCNRLLPVKS